MAVPQGADAAIRTVSLTKRYGPILALNNLHLVVERGSVFGLIGPNGAGKTTTLRLLLDIIRPTSGSISILGVDPRSGGAALRRRIGYIPGELRLDGNVRGRALLQHLAEMSGPVAPGMIDSLAERVSLDLSRPIHTLSKGNRQKLGLVQAFMHEPELLILDEPTSGLDPLVQREFLVMLQEARHAGQSILLSSHILSEVQQAADVVAVLARGTVVAEGDIASLRIAGVRRVTATLSGITAESVRTALGATPAAESPTVTPTATGDLVRVSVTARGDIDPVIRALAQGEIRDLTVEEPDLEESVLELYARQEAHS